MASRQKFVFASGYTRIMSFRLCSIRHFLDFTLKVPAPCERHSRGTMLGQVRGSARQSASQLDLCLLPSTCERPRRGPRTAEHAAACYALILLQKKTWITIVFQVFKCHTQCH